MKHEFTALFEETENGWRAYAQEYPSIVVNGNSREDAQAKLTQAVWDILAHHQDTLQTKIQTPLEIDIPASWQIPSPVRHKELIEVIAGASHEMRTPFGTIISYPLLILEGLYGEVSQEIRDRLAVVMTNAHKALRHLNAVLDAAKIEQGTFPFDPQRLSFQEVWTRLNQWNADGLIQIQKQNTFPMVTGDPTWLTEAFIKLLQEYGGQSIRFHVDGKNLIVEIRLPDDDPYRHQHPRNAGIFVANHIIDLHHGTIHTDSQNSTHIITLPIVGESTNEA